MNEEEERVVIRDNRKIDRDAPPDTADEAVIATEEPAVEDQVPMVEAQLLDERTADLQRLQAEYANYRKRGERDRLLAGDAAVAQAVSSLIPVVDDLQRARDHGDVTGPFEAVAQKLDRALTMLGLTPFGSEGDLFDPMKHEAVQHDEREDVTASTCTTIMRRGYLFKDRLLRPAMVGVSDPISDPVSDPAPAEHDATESDRTQD